jgi:hypothetical protein
MNNKDITSLEKRLGKMVEDLIPTIGGEYESSFWIRDGRTIYGKTKIAEV